MRDPFAVCGSPSSFHHLGNLGIFHFLAVRLRSFQSHISSRDGVQRRCILERGPGPANPMVAREEELRNYMFLVITSGQECGRMFSATGRKCAPACAARFGASRCGNSNYASCDCFFGHLPGTSLSPPGTNSAHRSTVFPPSSQQCRQPAKVCDIMQPRSGSFRR